MASLRVAIRKSTVTRQAIARRKPRLAAIALLCWLWACGASAQPWQPPAETSSAAAEVPFELKPFRNWLATHRQRAAEAEDPIQTDRPSFTASQMLVPKGWVQLESGYQFTYNRQGPLTTNTNAEPQLNLRIGLYDWLELRNLWAGVESILERNSATGARRLEMTSANFQTGFKIRASQAEGWIPQSALITTLFVPTGYGATATDNVVPLIDYIYTWTPIEHFTLTGSTGALFAEHRGQGHNEYFQSVVLGGEWEKWSTFFEWYITGDQAIYRQTSGANIDAGVLWRPWPNVQFDWRAGHGLTSTADAFFTGVGFSTRY